MGAGGDLRHRALPNRYENGVGRNENALWGAVFCYPWSSPLLIASQSWTARPASSIEHRVVRRETARTPTASASLYPLRFLWA